MTDERLHKVLTNGLLIPIPPGELRLEIYRANIIHIKYTPDISLPQRKSLIVIREPSPTRWGLKRVDSRLVIRTDKVEVHVDPDTKAISFYSSSGELVLKEGRRKVRAIEVAGERAFQVEQELIISSDEGLYGLGQHPGIFNYKGHTITLIQRNWDVAVPFLVSSKGYGILWDNYSMTRVSSFRDDEGEKLTWWSEVADAIDYYFIYGPRLDDVIASYRWLTGEAPLLPKWAYGYWQSKERYASQDEIVEVVKRFRERRIPIDVIVQDWKYWGRHGWNAFKFDERHYPDPAKMLADLHSLNVHLLVSIWPIFDPQTDVFKEMSKRGYICPGTLCYDPFNEGARALYWEYIKKAFFSIGVDGWWLDATEPETGAGWSSFYTPFHDTKTAMGPGARYLNAYSLMTTRAVYEGQRKDSNKRVVILTRSAFAGQQRYAAITWSGDICHDWGVLREQIPAGLNFCLSGLPYWTMDIGGFFSGNPESESYKEIFIRWFQWGALCPIFRVHGTTYAKEPWRFGKEVEEVLVRYIHLRYRLLPYIYSVAWKVTSEGYTMMRALIMDFNYDPKVINIDDQYMFGPFIMVSPVTLPKATHRRVYLPKTFGGWYDFWTGEKFEGGQDIEAPAPLDRIPLHVKAGAIIPMGPYLQYVDEKPADPIELRIYRGADGCFEIYEDNGEDYSYEKGSYAIIPIKWNEKEQKLVIGKRQGGFKGMLEERTFFIVWVREGHGVGIEPAKPDVVVHYNGRPVVVKYPR